MRSGWLGQSLEVVAGVMIALSVTQGSAEAARHKPTSHVTRASNASHGSANRVYSRAWRPSWQRSTLQCVPFARENSGIELSGNAGTWWDNATGLYERGARPEVGSILNFRSTRHMRMGHVAVVTNVISARQIEIDHANWASPGRISRNIDVVDVSPGNDWTSVRVAIGDADEFGSTYPTFGFIYDRPDRGVMVANNMPATGVARQAAPTGVRLASERINLPTAAAPIEVAEALGDDDDAPAPRYSSRHRATRHMAASTQTVRQRGAVSARATVSTRATVYRVSTPAVAVSKPTAAHKAARRRV